jgi:membrane protein DedA with SNARE-associated domain
MSEAILEGVRSSAWAAIGLCALLAWLEYVFPPSPGDTTVLFAFFLAGAGSLPLAGVAAAAFAGSLAGAATACAAGRLWGRSYFFLRSRWARHELDRLETAFVRHGAPLLLLNRFLPGVRGLFLYAAGIGRVGWRPVLVYSTISNVLWLALLAWAGARLGSSWEDVQVVFRRYVWGIGIAVAVYVVWSIRQRRRRAAAHP